jgi:hypothetical protein
VHEQSTLELLCERRPLGVVASTPWRLDAVPISTLSLHRLLSPEILGGVSFSIRLSSPFLYNSTPHGLDLFSPPPSPLEPFICHSSIHSIHRPLPLLHPHGFPRQRNSPSASTRKGHLSAIQVPLSPMWSGLQQTRTPGMRPPLYALPRGTGSWSRWFSPSSSRHMPSPPSPARRST